MQETRRKASGEELYAAVKCNQLEIARLLLQHGANPNACKPETNSYTALCQAAWDENMAMVEMLLSAGAVLKGALYEASVGVQYTCMRDDRKPAIRDNVRVVRALLAAGADANDPSLFWDQTPLGVADNADIIELLLQAGANPNVVTDTLCWCGGVTPLFSAVIRADIRAVKLLLAAHADVNVTTRLHNWTPRS